MRHILPLLLLMACTGGDDTDTDDTDTDTDVVDTDTDTIDSNRVRFETSLGAFTVELDPDAAPITVSNFLRYVDDGFYDGDDGEGATIFHRVIDGFVVQGGGFTETTQKATLAPIYLESDNGLSNLRGTIAMARTSIPDSATSQFYVNLVHNTSLDYQNANNLGYAVFGQVVEGMGTIDAIADVSVDGNGRPATAVTITDCERVP